MKMKIFSWYKSKSLKETRYEIDRILGKLENQETNLEDSISDYQG